MLICYGTRPEFIKVKSLIENLDNIKTVFTGQHSDLVSYFNDFKPNLTVTIDNISNNRLNDIIISILKHNLFGGVDYVMVQGDTTSALAIALSAFHYNKKVIHLEAGLRTYDNENPYPEEMNRQIISRIASLHLCPTELNKSNLLKENITSQIYVTGNTGLDSITRDNCFYGNIVPITLHRRDNHPIMDKWFIVISEIAQKFPELNFILPIHPNPNVIKHKNLLKGINVIDPISHTEMIGLIKKSRFVISDSGGIQEEASYLNKKVIICRKTTERNEIIGRHGIICSEPDKLYEIVKEINKAYEINEPCPFGDGMAWKKIKDCLSNYIK